MIFVFALMVSNLDINALLPEKKGINEFYDVFVLFLKHTPGMFL